MFDLLKDGSSFTTFRNVLSKYSGCPIIFLIKSKNGAVFGGFYETEIGNLADPKFVGNGDCFVFQIKPKVKVFKNEDEENEFYFYLDFDNLYMGGGGNGPALEIGGDLKRGRSCKSETFGNDPLHRTGIVFRRRDEFEILELEILCLH